VHITGFLMASKTCNK